MALHDHVPSGLSRDRSSATPPLPRRKYTKVSKGAGRRVAPPRVPTVQQTQPGSHGELDGVRTRIFELAMEHGGTVQPSHRSPTWALVPGKGRDRMPWPCCPRTPRAPVVDLGVVPLEGTEFDRVELRHDALGLLPHLPKAFLRPEPSDDLVLEAFQCLFLSPIV